MYENISEALDAYDEELDELYPVDVAGMQFLASRVLREVDPTAYRCGFWDWLDSQGIDSDSLDEYGSDRIPN